MLPALQGKDLDVGALAGTPEVAWLTAKMTLLCLPSRETTPLPIESGMGAQITWAKGGWVGKGEGWGNNHMWSGETSTTQEGWL